MAKIEIDTKYGIRDKVYFTKSVKDESDVRFFEGMVIGIECSERIQSLNCEISKSDWKLKKDSDERIRYVVGYEMEYDEDIDDYVFHLTTNLPEGKLYSSKEELFESLTKTI